MYVRSVCRVRRSCTWCFPPRASRAAPLMRRAEGRASTGRCASAALTVSSIWNRAYARPPRCDSAFRRRQPEQAAHQRGLAGARSAPTARSAASARRRTDSRPWRAPGRRSCSHDHRAGHLSDALLADRAQDGVPHPAVPMAVEHEQVGRAYGRPRARRPASHRPPRTRWPCWPARTPMDAISRSTTFWDRCRSSATRVAVYGGRSRQSQRQTITAGTSSSTSLPTSAPPPSNARQVQRSRDQGSPGPVPSGPNEGVCTCNTRWRDDDTGGLGGEGWAVHRTASVTIGKMGSSAREGSAPTRQWV
jgi:hypothetical protein